MPTRDEFVRYVTDFLAAPKTLAGVDTAIDWGPGRQHQEQCIKLPLAVNGVQTGEQFVVAFTPGLNIHSQLITVNGVCVCRLDYDPHGGHRNGFVAHLDGLPGVIQGTHFHRWELNTRFVESTATLPKLKHASALPQELHTFDNYLRFFCGETNIALPNGHWIQLPMLIA